MAAAVTGIERRGGMWISEGGEKQQGHGAADATKKCFKQCNKQCNNQILFYWS